jgi:hypothetical protein
MVYLMLGWVKLIFFVCPLLLREVQLEVRISELGLETVDVLCQVCGVHTLGDGFHKVLVSSYREF